METIEDWIKLSEALSGLGGAGALFLGILVLRYLGFFGASSARPIERLEEKIDHHLEEIHRVRDELIQVNTWLEFIVKKGIDGGDLPPMRPAKPGRS